MPLESMELMRFSVFVSLDNELGYELAYDFNSKIFNQLQ